MKSSDSFTLDPTGFDFDLSEATEDGWVRFSNGGLSQPVSLKLRLRAGEVQVIGLCIDNEVPVTARTMREPRLEEMARVCAEYVTDIATGHTRSIAMYEQMLSNAESKTRPDEVKIAGLRTDLDKRRDWQASTAAWVADLQIDEDGQELAPRGRGAAPPTEDELKRFAVAYVDARRTQPRRAVAATAERIGVNRSTVHRWRKLCQDASRSYLPAPSGSGD